jgi:hypothetical protein
VRYRRLLISLLFLGAMAAALAQTSGTAPQLPRRPAVGDLLVAPTRLILDDRTRTAEVTLINVGAARATYRVSFLHQRMTEVGEMKILEPGQEQPEEMFADKLVRFTPRQVLLEPRVAQTLRVQLRLPEGLAEGEYRSHLLFRAVPEAAAPADLGAADAGKGVSIQLRPIYGVSIPLIVRHGKTSATVTIADVALHAAEAADQRPALTLRLNRTGNASSYGNVVVNLLRPGSKAVTVGTMSGVAVYTQNASRLVRMPLTIPEGVKLLGALQVTYQEPAEHDGTVLAETTLQLP